MSLNRRQFVTGSAVALAAVAFGATGCSGSSNSSNTSASTDDSKRYASTEKPEYTDIKWARANSGNIFVTLGMVKGYFGEYGLTVTEQAVDSTTDALTALNGEKVDVTSNNGTNNPLSQIAKGVDLTMVGGYMLKGMYIIAPAGTKWNGVKDLVGKKFAGPASQTAITGRMLKEGLDPVNDVNWLTYSTNSDRMNAVIAGEADYAVLSGDLLQTVNGMKEIEIVAWLDDLTPNYGCCRMNLRTKFVNDNPNTVKLLLKALLRAECYFNANKQECIEIQADHLKVSKDYVAAFLGNENYVPSVDPVRQSILETWDTMAKTGFLTAEQVATVNPDDHINTKIYKSALDELVEQSKGSKDEAFYKERVEFFNAHN